MQVLVFQFSISGRLVLHRLQSMSYHHNRRWEDDMLRSGLSVHGPKSPTIGARLGRGSPAASLGWSVLSIFTVLSDIQATDRPLCLFAQPAKIPPVRYL